MTNKERIKQLEQRVMILENEVMMLKLNKTIYPQSPWVAPYPQYPIYPIYPQSPWIVTQPTWCSGNTSDPLPKEVITQ